jgi:hypothetical protein
MTLTLRAVLLAGAILFFILAIAIEGNAFKLAMIGLALFAGSFLVADTKLGGRTLR